MTEQKRSKATITFEIPHYMPKEIVYDYMFKQFERNVNNDPITGQLIYNITDEDVDKLFEYVISNFNEALYRRYISSNSIRITAHYIDDEGKIKRTYERNWVFGFSESKVIITKL